jgi:hypothetical protein
VTLPLRTAVTGPFNVEPSFVVWALGIDVTVEANPKNVGGPKSEVSDAATVCFIDSPPARNEGNAAVDVTTGGFFAVIITVVVARFDSVGAWPKRVLCTELGFVLLGVMGWGVWPTKA